MEDSVRVRGENNQRQRRFREKQSEFFLKFAMVLKSQLVY